MNIEQRKVAVVLFNLGGPDRLESVEPFLFNLFNDKHIITLPQPFRYLLAKFISKTRNAKSREIYEKLGGKSPILDQTNIQASLLENMLNENSDESDICYKTFVAMRYWHPMTPEIVENVKSFEPDHIILLPLYPQYSTTTTLSSVREWFNILKKKWKNPPKTDVICCYYDNPNFISAYASLICETLNSISQSEKKIRILFSAHGLPQKIVDAGDPYQFQIEKTVETVMLECRTLYEEIFSDIEHTICYQSKVGRLKWLEPDTESEIIKAAKNNEDIVVVPIAFVSEHSETLVELDIDYKELAESYGARFFRVPTVGSNSIFIRGLTSMCLDVINSSSKAKITINDGRGSSDKTTCPHAMCCKKVDLV